MASVKKLDSGRYRARYRDASGKEHARHFTRKRDADAWVAEQVSAMQRGTWVDPRDTRVTVKAYADQWLRSLPVRDTTRREYGQNLKRYLLPALGDVQLGRVTPTMARNFATDLSARVAATTAARTIRLCGQVFRAAVADNMIPRDPFASVSVGKPNGQTRHIPTVAEVRSVAEQVPDLTTRTAVVVAAATGMRVGELRALRVSDVNFMRRRIQIVHTMVELPGEPWKLGDPKTPRARRTITVPQSVVGMLAALLAERPAADNGLIFHQDGRPVPYSVMDKRLKAAAKRAGTPPLTWHALRHHAASVMIAAGVPVPAITAQLGHANPSITFSTYAHLLSDDAAAADTALSNAWETADNLRTVSGVRPA